MAREPPGAHKDTLCRHSCLFFPAGAGLGVGGGSSCQLQGVPSQVSCPLTHQHTEEALRSRKASNRATYQGVCTF